MAQNYPLASFSFIVNWGGTRIGFSEVSGLDMEVEPIEYRAGDSAAYHTIKMPGLRKFANITLKRGLMKADNDFFKWFNNFAGSNVERRDITISLLDENRAPAVTWKVQNAWPTKLECSNLSSMTSEVAIETLVLACENITIEMS